MTTCTDTCDDSCPPADLAPDLRPVEGPDAAEDLARYAKALSHPSRVQIVQRLARQDTCMYGDIASTFQLAQSTVSQHLKVLKEAGLIRGTVEGPRVCYCLEPRALRRLKVLVAAL